MYGVSMRTCVENEHFYSITAMHFVNELRIDADFTDVLQDRTARMFFLR